MTAESKWAMMLKLCERILTCFQAHSLWLQPVPWFQENTNSTSKTLSTRTAAPLSMDLWEALVPQGQTRVRGWAPPLGANKRWSYRWSSAFATLVIWAVRTLPKRTWDMEIKTSPWHQERWDLYYIYLSILKWIHEEIHSVTYLSLPSTQELNWKRTAQRCTCMAQNETPTNA